MEPLKTRKKVLKSALTRLSDKVALSITDDVDSTTLLLYNSKISDIMNDFKLLFDSIFVTCKPEELEQFIKEKENVDDSIDELRLKVNRKMNKNSYPEHSSDVVKHVVSDVNLPTLSMPNFNGKIENWIMFKDMFVASVIENKSISNSMKLQYLKASCKDEALRVIQSISISDANFEIAWKLLEDRYSNKRELLNAIIKKLLCQPNISESSSAILNLIDVTNESIRSLEVLNYKVEDLSETMIVFIIVEKLDKSTRYWWEKELTNSDDFGTLKQLLSFLQSQARTLQNSKIKEIKKSHSFPSKVSTMISTSNAKNSKFKCVKCQSQDFHGLYKCPEFINLSVNDRCEFVKRNNLCFNCLKFHAVRNCTSFRCQKCSKKHSTLLHFENEKQNRIERQEVGDKQFQTIAAESSNLNPNAANFESPDRNIFSGAAVEGGEGRQTKTVILSTANIFVKDCYGNYKLARALLDQGSMACFVTTEFADLLQIKKEKVCIAVSGLNNAKVNVSSKVSTVISNKSDFEVKLEFLCVPKISSAIPIESVQISKKHLHENIKLADPYFYRSGKIDVLLGAEVFYQLLRFGQIAIPNSELRFQNSVFGFIATGSISYSQPEKMQQTHCGLIYDCCDIGDEIKKFWQLESIGIKDDSSCNEINQSIETFEKTIRYKNNRYEVNLPWKRDSKELSDNFNLAKRRLGSLMKRLRRDKMLYSEYCKVLNGYVSEGIIEEVTNLLSSTNKPVFYLPHQVIIKNESLTTKLRIVFDASAHEVGQLSLNDCLYQGVNLNPNIFELLIFFRLNKIAILADVEKAFLQIALSEKDRDVCRFLVENDVQVYRFNRVLFGVNSSPFLLAATIKIHIGKYYEQYPNTVQVLDSCFYVDDLVTGEDDVLSAFDMSQAAVKIMSEAGMTLRKWITNDNELMKQWKFEHFDHLCIEDFVNQPHHVLGLSWYPKNDCLTLGLKSLLDFLQQRKNTKRFLLKAAGRIFDPIGFVSPFTIRFKILFQEIWQRKIDWDNELPADIGSKFEQWCMEVPLFNALEIPRYVLECYSDNSTEYQIHTFSDASNKAYGAVVYVRLKTSNKVYVHLLASKSRVAPLKQITLPRLELMGAVIAARLAKEVSRILNRKIKTTHHFWTDSKVVLSWIQGSSNRWKVFVANRVKEIQSLTTQDSWHHCPGKDNPSDLLTRGISAHSLLNCEKWWKGPSFLHKEVAVPESDNELAHDSTYLDELKSSERKNITLSVTVDSNFLSELLSMSNSFQTIVRVVSYIFRFIRNCRQPSNKQGGPLQMSEILQAETTLVKLVQQVEFSSELKDLCSKGNVSPQSKIKGLFPFLDSDNVLRVGGRLARSDLNHDKKFPVILPNKHRLTFLVLEMFHRRHLHVGPQTLLSLIRQRFWPLNGRNMCRQLVNKCVVCFKAKPVTCSQIMGQLPTERISQNFPFNCVGIDFCGHFWVKYPNQRKGVLNKVYVCVFICMVTKACHLEIVTDLSSDAFIATLKRFFSRRGKSSRIFTDNASNFVGTQVELKRLNEILSNGNHNLNKFLCEERRVAKQKNQRKRIAKREKIKCTELK